MHFLAWLAEHNFTFLGMREYRLEGEGADRTLLPLADSGPRHPRGPRLPLPALGHRLRRDDRPARGLPRRARAADGHQGQCARRASTGAAYMDYIGIKLYGEGSQVTGELRIIGLFTSMSLATPAYRGAADPAQDRRGHAPLRPDPNSHAGKALMAALDQLSARRTVPDRQRPAVRVRHASSPRLADRPRVRVLPRIDRFDNFVSVLVYVPRDRYNSEARAQHRRLSRRAL